MVNKLIQSLKEKIEDVKLVNTEINNPSVILKIIESEVIELYENRFPIIAIKALIKSIFGVEIKYSTLANWINRHRKNTQKHPVKKDSPNNKKQLTPEELLNMTMKENYTSCKKKS